MLIKRISSIHRKVDHLVKLLKPHPDWSRPRSQNIRAFLAATPFQGRSLCSKHTGLMCASTQPANGIEKHNGEGVKPVLSGDFFGGFKIEGVSIAGQETCIILPELDIVFDTGRCPQRSCYQSNVLITHAHLDHIGGLPYIVGTRSMQGLPPSKVYLPTDLVPGTAKLLNCIAELGQGEWQFDLNACTLGDQCQIKPQLFAAPFMTEHRITSQGYLIRRLKKKLKKEYLGLPGKDIKRLKDEGKEIEEHVSTPEVAFTGDTTIDFLDGELSQEVLDAKLLIMETTILDDLLAPDEVKERGHIHLEHVVENAQRFKNKAILFIHVSPRYSKEQTLEILNAKLPEELKSRCGVLLEGFK